MEFNAVVTRKNDQGKVTSAVETINEHALPQEGGVTVAVEYSTVNYKDGLCLSGKGGLVRNYPHIAGIDLAGTVVVSEDQRFQAGDPVLLTGWRVGETWWGGYAERARVKGDWLLPRPSGLSARQAMAVGTAGFTAMLAVMALEDHGLEPDQGEVLVTGAAGGVGSVAVAILASLGYQVAAVTGRAETADYLRSLGAATIIEREALSSPPAKPLDRERWAGCVDAVGGTMLSHVLTQIRYGGSVAAVGLAGGSSLNTTVIPFLLRGVNLLGIDSVMQPTAARARAWQRVASDLPMAKLDSMVNTIGLPDVPEAGRRILAGEIRGRTVVAVQ